MTLKVHRIEFNPARTYSTRENAIMSVERLFPENEPHFGSADLRYVIAVTAEGRFYPLFIGAEAVSKGIFHKFCVAA